MTDRRRAVPLWRGLVLGAGALAMLTGCTQGPATPPPTPVESEEVQVAEPQLTLHPGTTELERIVSAVLARHLTHRGIPAVVADPSTQPWLNAGGERAAVVDTLQMGALLDPDQVTGPVPTPTAAASPEASASPSPEASPGGEEPPSPEPTESATPDPVPDGEPAPDAGGVDALVRDQLPDETEFIAQSSGTLRLQAVTTRNLAALKELEELMDLNGQCTDLTLTPQSWGQIQLERLSVLAGCTPETLLDTGDRDPASAVVAGEAGVALLYGVDPAISHHALVPLEDPRRILPEGRLSVVADPQGLPDGARNAISEVLQRLDGTQIADLQALIQGPDPLSAEEAAQYWLVQNGLETAPESWF